jgi:hypothetical protein
MFKELLDIDSSRFEFMRPRATLRRPSFPRMLGYFQEKSMPPPRRRHKHLALRWSCVPEASFQGGEIARLRVINNRSTNQFARPAPI